MKKLPPQQLQRHLPVLLEQTLHYLSPQKGESYLDLTAGYGGHAGAVINSIGDAHLATLVDRDETSIAAIRPFAEAGARVLKNSYADAASILHEAGEQFDMILIDLGVSSPQLDVPQRGFSFRNTGPLDMRMDQHSGFTAEELLNKASKDELMHILRVFGEEPRAAAIAQAIIHARPLKTTTDLAVVVERTIRGKWGKTHPATRTFQAIRIAVNDELGQIERTLPLLPDLLRPGGRLVVISFHSLEDRLVKHFFKEQADAGYEATLQIVTKHPISGQTHDVSNPRARSAQLRAAVKIKK
ncbi:MAG TPA: 16S rRNA (cytosine(1402)-N(4))-methyltransferase RsmH [Candidatus Saccharimonadales bacterium]|nr:16S rRNA (cytosine(1402)-N(4))-methyltransferase RsmH [Candidatus Saccharimonadales bacterium]